MSRRLAPALAALALAALAPAAQALTLEPVATGFDAPLLAVAAPGQPDTLYVVEQGGTVRIVRGGRTLPSPFLDISDRISSGGEQGLLGLAFHPRFAENGRLYVDFTDPAGDTRVVEYRVGRDADAVDPGTARRILAVDQPFSNHNGGHLAFGPDGFLHVGLGDGGGGGDPLRAGQRLDTLLGKILRIDVDRRSAGRAYAIPPGNPFAGRRGARAEIWHLGLRNPWRFSFDRQGGAMWIGDVGQNAIEEVSRAPAGRGGLNFGWNAFEGTTRFPGGGPARGRVVGPVAQYTHAKGCSVTGGFVSRGPAAPSLRGRYVYADYCSGRVWTVPAGARRATGREITARLGRTLQNVTSFGEDAQGNLLIIGSGSVFRFRG
ncbi:MAG: PQQ-dependent sugar dehydrogenase [Thermoleophilia bacterium]|jgi:glucose/arabinose dehydrogenase|nr:PQQ-dependent sugar dehydrogenase [Thermoleophilia bacterium]